MCSGGVISTAYGRDMGVIRRSRPDYAPASFPVLRGVDDLTVYTVRRHLEAGCSLIMDVFQPSNLLLEPEDDLVERARLDLGDPPKRTATLQSLLGNLPDNNLVHFVVAVSAPQRELANSHDNGLSAASIRPGLH